MKPGNILIADDGQPLILDFHLSAENTCQKESSFVGGTIPYMSAQHLKSLNGDGKVDFSCDVFSLGVILFEALTGQLPYTSRGASELAVAEMIADRSRLPRDARELNKEVSPAIASIVRHCLQPRSGGYQTAEQLQTDIDLHLNDQPLEFAPNTSVTERAQKWMRRRPRTFTIAMMTALGLAMFVGAALAINSRLNHAAQVEAVQQSREFVDSLRNARLPLTFGNSSPPLLEERCPQLRTLLGAGLSEENAGRRSLLPVDVLNDENENLVESAFWLARSSLSIGINSEGKMRETVLGDAADMIESVTDFASTGTNPKLVELQALIEIRIGNEQRAELLRGQILPESDEDQVNEYLSGLFLATELQSEGRYDEALAELSELSEVRQADYQIWLMKGHAYAALGRAADAVASYTVCIGIDPESAWAFNFRGLVNLADKKFQAARDDFDIAIALEDSNWSRLNRALAMQGLGEFETAVDDLSTAIERRCSETRALYLRSRLYARMGREDEAAEDMHLFLETEPTDDVSWLSRGMANIAIDNPERALEDFQAALRLNPQSVDACQNIATVQAEFLDQTDSAIEAMSNVIELQPENVVAIATRGVLYGRNGDREHALADAQLALQKDRSADTFFRVAGIFALLSRENEPDREVAIHFLQRAGFENGKLVLSRVLKDGDLDPVRETEEFKELISTLETLSGKQ